VQVNVPIKFKIFQKNKKMPGNYKNQSKKQLKSKKIKNPDG